MAVGIDEKTQLKPLGELGIGDSGGAAFIPYLVLVEGPRQGARFPLRGGDNVGGRLPSNDIVLEDQSVSRQHFTVMRADTGISVKDNESKNGTSVNGQSIQSVVTVGHGDIIQVGIYALRLITRSVAPDEELAPLPADYEGRTVMTERPADAAAETATTFEDDAGTANVPDQKEITSPQLTELDIKEEPDKRRPRWVRWGLFGVLIVLIAGLGTYVYWEFFRAPPPAAPLSKPQLTQTPPPVQQCPPGQKPVEPKTDPIQCVPDVPTPKMVPIFLDFASSPLPAKVQFEGKDYGLTPVKPNIQLEVGKTYTADAVFHLDELQEDLTEHFTFTVKATDTAIPVLFRAPIGIIKVMKLPRDVELTAQGFFAYDQFHPKTMTLSNIAYGKPLYVPYGRYVLELRAPRPIGDGGQVVSDIRYRREIFLTEDAPTFAVEVADEALTQFPVEIRSTPDHADLFIDATPVGKTPYTGFFPTGEHTLTLRKEGYFEHTEQIKNEMNVLYQREIVMKTTAAGERLNEGHSLLIKGMYKEAIAKLAEVFQQNPLPVETAKAQYLLGSAYLGLNDIATAQGYFEQAKNHPDYELQSKLGLVNIVNMQGDKPKAITLLVEVMLKAQDEAIKTEAANTFKTVSPFKSVLYVYSDPAGATVMFNDQPVGQKTPLIMSDLGLGNYRLRIQKDGYEPQDVSMNVTIHEFNPVIVKLKPIAK